MSMRCIKLVLALASVMAMMLVASVTPALANDNSWNNNDHFRFHRFNDGLGFLDRFDNHGVFFDGLDNNNDGISQENEQEVQSGDATQGINVSGGGDNS